MQASKMLRVALVVGEPSGDTLGAGLVRAMREIRPDEQFEFVGIAGPLMQEQGVRALYQMHELSVMGLVEVLKHLPRLLKIRHNLISYLCRYKPDVFIGIDAPDFNLTVEKKLKKQGIKTIHYVSPSVWAWRQGRVHFMREATDLVLSLLPFEKQFFDKHQVPCQFVGHTLADQIPIKPQNKQAQLRQELGLDQKKESRWIALLPGSRSTEINQLGPVFLRACRELFAEKSDYGFLVPMINQQRLDEFKAMQKKHAPHIPMYFFLKKAHAVINCADLVILASGTATLEAMLLKKPMIVGYRVHDFSYWLAKRLVKVPYISLPNLLAGEAVVPELIQDACNATHIVDHARQLLAQPSDGLHKKFSHLHQQIACDADKTAALAVLRQLEQ